MTTKKEPKFPGRLQTPQAINLNASRELGAGLIRPVIT